MFKKEKYTESKLGVPDDPNSFSDHHRKPEKLGGKRTERNISSVSLYKHRAWHILYREFEAFDIIVAFTQDYEIYGTDFVKSNLLKKLHEGYANTTDEKIKRTQAWYTLFRDKNLEEIVQEINTVWLDPDYEILIGMIRVKTVQLHKKILTKNKQ